MTDETHESLSPTPDKILKFSTKSNSMFIKPFNQRLRTAANLRSSSTNFSNKLLAVDNSQQRFN